MDIQKMLAREIMNSPLITASPEVPAQKIVEIMAERRISTVVIEEKPPEASVITSGNVLRWIAKHPRGLEGITARDLMHGPALCIKEDDAISAAVQLMAAHGVKRVLVENAAREKVGIITLKNLMTWNSTIFQPATALAMLVVANVGGIVLFHHKFPLAAQVNLGDFDLFGASMSALSSLTSELIDQSGEVKVLRKEKFVIMFEARAHVTCILVADRESIELRKSLMSFIDEVEQVNRETLEQQALGKTFPLGAFTMLPTLQKQFPH